MCTVRAFLYTEVPADSGRASPWRNSETPLRRRLALALVPDQQATRPGNLNAKALEVSVFGCVARERLGCRPPGPKRGRGPPLQSLDFGLQVDDSGLQVYLAFRLQGMARNRFAATRVKTGQSG